MTRSLPQLLLLPLLTFLLGFASPQKTHAATKLPQLVHASDNAIWGRVLSRRIEVQAAGEEEASRKFEVLLIDGFSLFNGRLLQAEITIEMSGPKKTHAAIGSEVVAFFRWCDDITPDIPGNILTQGQGALHRSPRAADGSSIILGAGAGRVIPRNISLDAFQKRVAILFRDRS